jgi:hypothetical protein
MYYLYGRQCAGCTQSLECELMCVVWQARARSEYWRCLDDYYEANQYADYVMWLQQRRAWALKQLGFKGQVCICVWVCVCVCVCIHTLST